MKKCENCGRPKRQKKVFYLDPFNGRQVKVVEYCPHCDVPRSRSPYFVSKAGLDFASYFHCIEI